MKEPTLVRILLMNEKHNKGGKRIKITREQEKKLCELYEQGINAEEIACRLSIGATTVGKYLDKNDIPRHNIRSKIDGETSILIVNLYRQGMSQSEISSTLSIGKTTVSRHLKKNGITKRTWREINNSFTEDEEKIICEEYKDKGLSAFKIANRLGVGSHRIRDVLRRNNISRRESGFARRFSEKEETKICDLYKRGNSTLKIGKIYGAGHSTIRRILRRRKIQLRTSIEARGGLDEEMRIELCNKYQDGENIVDLAEEYGIGETTANSIITKAGIQKRTLSESHGGVSQDEHQKIIESYIVGNNTRVIGNQFNISQSTVSKILNDNKIQRRSLSEARGGLSQKDVDQVCILYKSGKSTLEIAKIYNKQESTINRTLKRANIKIRSVKEAMGGLPESMYTEIANRYLSGQSAPLIGEEFGIHSSTVYKYLTALDVERREGGFTDTVQDALENINNFSDIRETFFYIYGLHGFPKYLKPGITFDVDSRVRNSSGYYGEEHLLLVFETRHEAYFLEKAILNETIDFADCPPKLLETQWAGCTELRNIELDLLSEIVDYFVSMMSEMNMWEFAFSYVPMSSCQREECERRAYSVGFSS